MKIVLTVTTFVIEQTTSKMNSYMTKMSKYILDMEQ